MSNIDERIGNRLQEIERLSNRELFDAAMELLSVISNPENKPEPFEIWECTALEASLRARLGTWLDAAPSGDALMLLMREKLAAFTGDQERAEFIGKCLEGYCPHCGGPEAPGRPCRCWDDE